MRGWGGRLVNFVVVAEVADPLPLPKAVLVEVVVHPVPPRPQQVPLLPVLPLPIGMQAEEGLL